MNNEEEFFESLIEYIDSRIDEKIAYVLEREGIGTLPLDCATSLKKDDLRDSFLSFSQSLRPMLHLG